MTIILNHTQPSLLTKRRASLFWLEGRAEPRDSKAYYSPCIHATRRHPKIKGYRLANLLARSECSSSRMPVAIRWLILSALPMMLLSPGYVTSLLLEREASHFCALDLESVSGHKDACLVQLSQNEALQCPSKKEKTRTRKTE